MKIEKTEVNYQVTECDLKFGEQITLNGEVLIPISVLNKIKAEIILYRRKTASLDPYDLVGDCFDIIDKYSEEGEKQKIKDTKKKEGIEL